MISSFGKIKVVFWILVIFCAAINYFHIKMVKADNARLKSAIIMAIEQAESMQKEIKLNRLSLAEREQKAAELAVQTEALQNELSELYANNEPCAAWADADVPGPVLDRLRK